MNILFIMKRKKPNIIFGRQWEYPLIVGPLENAIKDYTKKKNSNDLNLKNEAQFYHISTI